MSNDDFGHIGRRPSNRDDFDDIREQMAKERDAFFRDVNPRDWPRESVAPRSGYFTTPRSGYSGFPGGGGGGGLRREFGEVGPWPAQRPLEDDILPEFSGDSIPISVIHERSSADPSSKHKYGSTGSRNTTDIPSKTGGGECSPRLERAHSEPPNKFNQRLNLSRPTYTTIPENSEGVHSASQFAAGSNPSQNNPIKTSASAPSVPDARGGQPIPPPRKSPPRPTNMNPSNVNAPTQQRPSTTAVPSAGNNVRHIPIFVEGRAEPLFNTTLQSNAAAAPRTGPSAAPTSDLPFPKPSDYYPPGVKRIKSRDETDSPAGWRVPGQEPTAGWRMPVQEPTTPQGPPPGPIPMGYIPSQGWSQPTEPTTPMGPPPGPIPMGYLPSRAAVETESPLPAPADQPITLPCDPHLVETRSEEPSEPSRVPVAPPPPPVKSKPSVVNPPPPPDHPEAPPGAAEPVVNFIPIKVDQGRSTSPRPGSRPSSQEYQTKPGTSPRGGASPIPPPPKHTTGAPEEPNQAEEQKRDPRILKLETIDNEAEGLGPLVEQFQGSKKDKEYLFLDDKLTKLLISADNIQAEGVNQIRQMRKESCSKINKLADLLERKASTIS